jgi:hypothetical protein
MPIDVTVLTTRAECDEVLAGLEAELDGYAVRTTNLEYADRRTDRTQADAEGRLAGVEAEIAAYTAILAAPGITPALRKQNETKLRRANDRRDNLTDSGSARSAAARLLAAVDAEQVAAQVAVLTEAKTAVTAHRNTLSA